MHGVMSPAPGIRRGRRRRQRGQGLVEFALVVPVLFLLVFGVIDFGRGMSANVTVTNSAREGARTLATSLTLNEPSSWSTPGCASNVVCTLGMSCPQGSSSAPAPPADGTSASQPSGQARAWRQMMNNGLDLSSGNITMTASFFKRTTNDPANGNPADLVVTCTGYSVAPTYTFRGGTPYLPQTGDWVVFDVNYTYHPSTPFIGSVFSRLTMDQAATMVLE